MNLKHYLKTLFEANPEEKEDDKVENISITGGEIKDKNKLDVAKKNLNISPSSIKDGSARNTISDFFADVETGEFTIKTIVENKTIEFKVVLDNGKINMLQYVSSLDDLDDDEKPIVIEKFKVKDENNIPQLANIGKEEMTDVILDVLKHILEID